jgi:hypothetical protein
MKKILILMVLLAMALPLMAAPIVGGTEGASELTYGFIVGPDGYRSRWTNLIWTTVVNVNESNYILFGLTGGNNPSLSTFGLRAFSGNMILDKVLGLPEGVTIKLKFGLDDVIALNLPPSGYAYENVMPGADPGVRGTVAALATIKGVNIRLSVDPGNTISTFGLPVTNTTLLANVNTNLGPFFVSAAYFSAGQNLDKGKIGGDFQWNGKVGPLTICADVEPAFDMNTSLAVVGLAGTIKTEWVPWLTVDASTNISTPGSANPNGFNAFGIGIEARPDPELARWGGSLGFDFNLNPAVLEPIRSIDASVWFKALGPGKLRVGYLYTKTNNGGGDYYAPAALPNGGAYLKYDMSW